MHLDTIFMHQMHANGLQFVDVETPAVAYHMEHAEGSGWTPEGQQKHYAAVEQRGMPHIKPATAHYEAFDARRARSRGILV